MMCRCAQEFTLTNHGHEAQGYFVAVKDFVELFCFQGGMIVQRTPLTRTEHTRFSQFHSFHVRLVPCIKISTI